MLTKETNSVTWNNCPRCFWSINFLIVSQRDAQNPSCSPCPHTLTLPRDTGHSCTKHERRQHLCKLPHKMRTERVYKSPPARKLCVREEQIKGGFLAVTAARNARSHLEKKNQSSPQLPPVPWCFSAMEEFQHVKKNQTYLILIPGSQEISHSFISFILLWVGNARRHPFFLQLLTSSPCPHKPLHSHTLNHDSSRKWPCWN